MRDGVSPKSSSDLLQCWLGGDEQAAAELWKRHATRLTGLARKLLSSELARDQDAEDVVQSVYLKFFAAARSRTPDLKQSGDLWRFLVAIMHNKMRDQHKAQQAQKRKADGAEEPTGAVVNVTDPQPPPGEQAALADELDNLLSSFQPHDRRMVALRLEGWNVEEIAAATAKSERTVRRVLKRSYEHLLRRFEELTR